MDMTHLKGEPSRILHQCGKLVSAFLLCFTTRAKLIIKIFLSVVGDTDEKSKKLNRRSILCPSEVARKIIFSFKKQSLD